MENFEIKQEAESMKNVGSVLATLETKEEFEKLLKSKVPSSLFDKLGKDKVLEAFLYLAPFSSEATFDKTAYSSIVLPGVDIGSVDEVIELLIAQGLLAREGERFKFSDPGIPKDLRRILSQYED